jgi:hypothetical protein
MLVKVQQLPLLNLFAIAGKVGYYFGRLGRMVASVMHARVVSHAA